MLNGGGPEIIRLQDELRLCRLELAHVRRQQEEAAEAETVNARATQRLRQLAKRLDKRLASGEDLTGPRGWLKRRLLSTMPRPHEGDALAVLRLSPMMDGVWYLRTYPEVVSTGLSPALHYLRLGAAEQKDPGPRFSSRKYVEQHPELPDGMNPLLHHLAASSSPTK